MRTKAIFWRRCFPATAPGLSPWGSPRVDSFLDPEAVQMGLEIPINGILNDRYAAKTSADVRRTLDMSGGGGSLSGPSPPTDTIRTRQTGTP